MKALITVTDREEAKKAILGGCNILDIKNPAEGSLGANIPWVINEIIEEVPGKIKTSIAVGDVPNLPGTVSLAVKGAAHFKPNYLKVGLKGPQSKEECINLMEKAVHSVRQVSNRTNVVAAGYGDWKRAETVNPLKIPEIADKSEADVAMIDTAIKDGKTLLDHLNLDELEEFISKSKKRGLTTALAGSLNSNHVEKISSTGVDIFGVRGAVCDKPNRTSQLKSELVLNLVNKIDNY